MEQRGLCQEPRPSAEHMIRFEFVLDPIPDIRPWTDGDGQHPRLHWFALTLGEYWIVVDDHELFRLDDATMDRFRADGFDARRYADYQVVRLWEDLINGFPAFVEPVPQDLLSFVTRGYLRPFDESDSPDVDAARTWHNDHFLDAGHIVLQSLRWWSDGADVWTEWFAPASDITSDAPSYGLVPRSFPDFERAVEDFDRRLIHTMANRVADVKRGAVADGIAVDIPQLEREQLTRASYLRSRLTSSRVTSWPSVRSGARTLLES